MTQHTDFASLTGQRRPLTIPEVESRGILPAQLDALVDFLRRRGTQEDGLDLSSVNLYHVTAWVIRPLTQQHECSYVEAVAEDAAQQRPSWFVSHWWGEAVVDFVACLRRHQALRSLETATAYWVCAYANNQHQLGVELGTDPMQSSFLKAMRLSQGILVVLDVAASPFGRIWCIFEQGVVALAARSCLKADVEEREALRELSMRGTTDGGAGPLMLDIATVDADREAHVLLEGLAGPELAQEERFQQTKFGVSGWDKKAQREAKFPMNVILKALNLVVGSATASQPEDRTRILNALAGRDVQELDHEPDIDSPNLQIIEQTLRSTFALAAWPQALRRHLDDEEVTNLLVQRLQEDVTRTHCRLNLKNLASPQALAGLSRGLAPLNLTHLNLDLSRSRDLTDLGTLPSALAGSATLRHCVLNLDSCRELVSLAPLGASLRFPTSLQVLHLDLSNCSSLADAAELVRALNEAKNLVELHLALNSCLALANVNDLGQHLPPSLQTLDLGLNHCYQVSLPDLGPGLARLTSLRRLSLALSYIQTLTSLDGLDLGPLNLETLHLDCAWCGDLAAAVLHLPPEPALRELTLILGGGALEHLEVPLLRLKKLTKLHLDLGDSRKLQEVETLKELAALGSLGELRELKLNLASCHALPDVKLVWFLWEGLEKAALIFSDSACWQGRDDDGDDVEAALASCTSMREFRLDLTACQHLQSRALARDFRCKEELLEVWRAGRRQAEETSEAD